MGLKRTVFFAVFCLFTLPYTAPIVGAYGSCSQDELNTTNTEQNATFNTYYNGGHVRLIFNHYGEMAVEMMLLIVLVAVTFIGTCHNELRIRRNYENRTGGGV